MADGAGAATGLLIYRATDAQLHWKGESGSVRNARLSREDLESFETVYNAACSNIAKGDFKPGEVLIKRAKGKVFLC